MRQDVGVESNYRLFCCVPDHGIMDAMCSAHVRIWPSGLGQAGWYPPLPWSRIERVNKEGIRNFPTASTPGQWSVARGYWSLVTSWSQRGIQTDTHGVCQMLSVHPLTLNPSSFPSMRNGEPAASQQRVVSTPQPRSDNANRAPGSEYPYGYLASNRLPCSSLR